MGINPAWAVRIDYMLLYVASSRLFASVNLILLPLFGRSLDNLLRRRNNTISSSAVPIIIPTNTRVVTTTTTIKI